MHEPCCYKIPKKGNYKFRAGDRVLYTSTGETGTIRGLGPLSSKRSKDYNDFYKVVGYCWDFEADNGGHIYNASGKLLQHIDVLFK